MALVSLVAGSLTFAAAPAEAAAPTQTGWWTSLAVAQPVPGGPPINPIGATAGPTDLVVAGGPADQQPLAYAALAFVLAPGEQAHALRLVVTNASIVAPGARVRACMLTAPSFAPAYGGPASTGPSFDCTRAVDGTLASDGHTITFDVTTLQSGSNLAVALIASPGQRLTFEAPDGHSLATTSPAPSAEPPPVTQSTTVVTSLRLGDTPLVGNTDPPTFKVGAPAPVAANRSIIAPPTTAATPQQVASAVVAGLLVLVAIGGWSWARRLAIKRSVSVVGAPT